MGKIKDMTLKEATDAYLKAIRNLPQGTHGEIVNNLRKRKDDFPLLAHAKKVYRRIQVLRVLAEGLTEVETGGCAPPVYVK